MGQLTFFFDSYALYEIFQGNKDYEKYKKEIAIITTKFNLMEFHYGILRTDGKEEADKQYDAYAEFTIEANNDAIKKASEFRLKHKEKKLSYVDCIGYVLAKECNAKFLTGDKQFEGMENVEFVK